MATPDDLKAQADRKQADDRISMAKQAEDKMFLDRRLADEKIAMEKQAEQKRMDEQKNGKKGDELDTMLMAGFTGIMMFSAWEGTKDGIKNMFDPKTSNDITKQDPHAEVAQYGAASPSGPAGGIGTIFGMNLSAGQSSSSMNARKIGEPEPGMNFRPA